MSLKEDFNNPSTDNEFGAPTSSSKTSKDAGNSDEDTSLDEAFDNIINEMDDELGVDKIDIPDEYGFDAAAKAMEDFSIATDGNDTDVETYLSQSLEGIKDLPEEKKQELREACQTILAIIESEETDDEECCPDCDEEGTNYGEMPAKEDINGKVDPNTVPAYPEEAEQFSEEDTPLGESFEFDDIDDDLF